jgi:hypothetical protein
MGEVSDGIMAVGTEEFSNKTRKLGMHSYCGVIDD